jgi:hypothetical protein
MNTPEMIEQNTPEMIRRNAYLGIRNTPMFPESTPKRNGMNLYQQVPINVPNTMQLRGGRKSRKNKKFRKNKKSRK